MQADRTDHWLTKFSTLRVDRARGDPAPHKPLLLLVLCDLAEEGNLGAGNLPLTTELAFRFSNYWGVVAGRRSQRPDIRLPFHHLAGDGIWSVVGPDGNPSSSKNTTKFARLPRDFVSFLENPANRQRARDILIAKYFRPAEQVALYEMIGIPAPDPVQIERNAQFRSFEEARKSGREARFRVRVITAYNFTCALTEYRLTTMATSLVDAAHIHEFRDSRNNDPRNGIALSKNAHWLFDQGLWTISDDYRVIVAAGQFTEAGPQQWLLLSSYHGRRLRLPADKSLWPDPLHLAWHRERRFVRG